jgi:hypothetical protein
MQKSNAASRRLRTEAEAAEQWLNKPTQKRQQHDRGNRQLPKPNSTSLHPKVKVRPEPSNESDNDEPNEGCAPYSPACWLDNSLERNFHSAITLRAIH